MKPVIIGDAELYLADSREIMPILGRVAAVITDPPYSERCHTGHDAGSGARGDSRDGSDRQQLGYAHLTLADVDDLAKAYAAISESWVVWMTDSDLALSVRHALDANGLTTFAPLPFYQAGRSVRLSGDGPCSWTDWIVPARTKAAKKWGTLPGGYIAGSGWNDKARMGGKPSKLMEALVCDYSRPGDIVLDTHMGAGTTGVAAINCGRKFIGIEIDADAFELSCRRIERAVSQGQLFSHEPPKQVQESLL